ncbi:MAG: hypothetical protein AABM67_08590 [Acidobacteriota bacterium]
MTESTNGAETVKDDAAPIQMKNATATEELETDIQAPKVPTKIDANGTKEAAAPDSVPTLREVFDLPQNGAKDLSDDRWQTVEKRISEEMKGIKWTAAMSDLVPKICDLLEIKVDDVLLRAWKKAAAIRTALVNSKLTPEQTTYLELAEHTVNSEHKPSIDVKLKGAKIKSIALLVHLGFKLQGFVLKIKNGAIVELQAGHCEVKGTIKFSGLTIAEKKLSPIRLPLTIPVSMPEEPPVKETKPAIKVEKKNREPLERFEI